MQSVVNEFKEKDHEVFLDHYIMCLTLKHRLSQLRLKGHCDFSIYFDKMPSQEG